FDRKLEKKFDKPEIIRISNPLEERYLLYQVIFLSKYVIHKLILREYIDPEDNEWELFLKKIDLTEDQVSEYYVKNKEFLNYDQLVLSEIMVNGPQNQILATLNKKESNGWQNAATGANYAKCKNCICFIVPDYTKEDKRELAFLLKEIDRNLTDYNKLVQISTEIGRILDKNIPIMATNLSQYSTLFLSDASIPYELIFRTGRFGIESIGKKFCIGRLTGDDIYDTTILTTSSLIFSLVPHDIAENVLLIGNPTKDLDFSQAETAFLKILLDFYGMNVKYYAGKKVSDKLLKNVEERSKLFGYEWEPNEIQPLGVPTKKIFIDELKKANIVHYSGHGGIDNRGPFLLLNDGEFLLEDIPDNLENNPFIFANACLAGLSVNYSKNISLASKFIESGAIGYIGALWRVSDATSLLLGTLFYDFLLFLPIGGVLQQLKYSLKQALPDDYTALSFLLYTDPTISWVDPFYKGVEAYYYLKNLNDTLNTNQEKRAKQYSERTLRAFKIFKKEIEERIKKRPDLKQVYNISLRNLEGSLNFLNGQYEIIKVATMYSKSFSTMDLEKFEIIGKNNIKVSDEFMNIASEKAFDPGSKFHYKMISNQQKIYGYLLIAITQYSKENYDSALKSLKKSFELLSDSKNKIEKQLREKIAGFAPFILIQKQLNIAELVLNGWKEYISGISEFKEDNDADKAYSHFNVAFECFGKIVPMGDIIMAESANNYSRILLYDYGILFFEKNHEYSNELFKILKSICEKQLMVMDNQAEILQREMPEEFERFEIIHQYLLALSNASDGFLNWISYKKKADKESKDIALEMFNQAIDITPNQKLKDQWEVFIKNI
ncbi:MAG: CHAT domain-containing protein, partial [Candidatus Lokiarchaeota archaeon]|nr:CHAT domain-containing protein [Candidatus Lokiarchaeota archaeon]